LPRDDLILAFDTSAAHCAAALLSRGSAIGQVHEPMARGQAERLFPLLEELLATAECTWRDLSRIAVGIGPGNFTGIRISVSSARGLALSLGIPAIGVSGFEALAHGLPRPIIASIDGRGGRIYLQRLTEAGPQEPVLATLDSLPSGFFQPGEHVVGHAAEEISSLTGAKALQPLATLAVSLALIGAQSSPQAAGRPTPLYLRPADAAPPKNPAPTVLP